jgi:outer membrane biosynthesis protein TonB
MGDQRMIYKLKRTGFLLTAGTALAFPACAWAQQPTTQTPGKTPTKPTAKQAAEKQPVATASKAVTSWRGQVMAHLNGQKRAFNAGAEGTATVTFAIDRSGKVLSAR